MIESNGSNKARIGDITEIKAQAWLLEQGYEVFRNVSCRGPVDILIMDADGNLTKIDVKKAVDAQRNRTRVNQPRLTEKQKFLNVKPLYYDAKKNIFAWDISYIRQKHNMSSERIPAHPTPNFVKEREFKSFAEMSRFYNVNPRSLRSRIEKGDTVEEAIVALQQRSKRVFVNGKEFPDKKRACEYFKVNYNSLEYWVYDKGKTVEESINFLLEKKK